MKIYFSEFTCIPETFSFISRMNYELYQVAFYRENESYRSDCLSVLNK